MSDAEQTHHRVARIARRHRRNKRIASVLMFLTFGSAGVGWVVKQFGLADVIRGWFGG